MEEEARDRRGVRVPLGQEPQLGGKRRLIHGIVLRLHDEHRLLLSARTDADERTARDPGMAAENLFHRLGVHYACGGFHALGNAAAKPQPPDGIEITGVAHSVPDGAGSAELRAES